MLLLGIRILKFLGLPDPDPFIKQKKKKTLNFYCFVTSLSLKTDLNVPQKVKSKENLYFVGILKATDEKSKIRIRFPRSLVQIRGSGSVPTCYGSTPLATTNGCSKFCCPHLCPQVERVDGTAAQRHQNLVGTGGAGHGSRQRRPRVELRRNEGRRAAAHHHVQPMVRRMRGSDQAQRSAAFRAGRLQELLGRGGPAGLLGRRATPPRPGAFPCLGGGGLHCRFDRGHLLVHVLAKHRVQGLGQAEHARVLIGKLKSNERMLDYEFRNYVFCSFKGSEFYS